MTKRCIAVDGFSASGKSTVSKIIAKKINFLYLDTGAMYRVVTAYCLKHNINFYDKNEFQNNEKNINISFKKGDLIYCNNEDFTNVIRSKEVCDQVSLVSSMQYVRDFLIKQQRKIAEEFDVVMDGRDIGTYVMPMAEKKFFLTCDIKIRAKRRYKENLQKNIICNLSEIEENLKKRDLIDTTRKINPLKKSVDAIEINTDFLTIEEVVDLMLKEIYK